MRNLGNIPPSNAVEENSGRWYRFIKSIIDEVFRLSDSIVNWRDISMFERIIQEIISENRIWHYDSSETYYEKLELMQEKRKYNEDYWDIKLISDGWMTYKIDWYENITFTRWELEKIWEKYTQLKIPELS